MTPQTQIESTLASHAERLNAVEHNLHTCQVREAERDRARDEAERDSQRELRGEISSLRNWIMSAVLAAYLSLIGVIGQVLSQLVHK